MQPKTIMIGIMIGMALASVPEEDFTESQVSVAKSDVNIVKGIIDDSEDKHPNRKNSEGLNRLTGDGRDTLNKDDGEHEHSYDYTDIYTGRTGHYYLGESRRRIGDGFGRRRRTKRSTPLSAGDKKVLERLTGKDKTNHDVPPSVYDTTPKKTHARSDLPTGLSRDPQPTTGTDKKTPLSAADKDVLKRLNGKESKNQEDATDRGKSSPRRHSRKKATKTPTAEASATTAEKAAAKAATRSKAAQAEKNVVKEKKAKARQQELNKKAKARQQELNKKAKARQQELNKKAKAKNGKCCCLAKFTGKSCLGHHHVYPPTCKWYPQCKTRL